MRSIHGFSLMALLLAVSLGCGKKDNTESTGTAAGGVGGTGTPPVGIEGEYLVIGAEVLGEKVPAEEIAKESEAERTVKISKDTILTMEKGKPVACKYTLDSSKSPAEIDVTFPAKGKKPGTRYGIYKLEGDTLTLYYMGSKEAKYRPKEFKTLDPFKLPKEENADHDAGVMIVILKKK